MNNDNTVLKKYNINEELFLDLAKNAPPMLKREIRTYDLSNTSMEDVLSLKRLEEIQLSHGDLNVARQIHRNDNRFRLDRDLIEELGDEVSGFFWYPYGGYCGWHTNNGVEGRRTYYSWAMEPNKSFFRYQDPDTKEIITKWDKKGVNIHTFNVSLDKPYWHCVGSYTNRISIGFNHR